MKKCLITKNKHGFSIIEIAIALAVLALIFGGMMSVLDRGFLAARKTNKRTTAYSLLREKLEEKFSTAVWPPVSEAQAAVPGFTGFQRSVTVTNPYLGFGSLALINVTVLWDSGAQSQSINTIKADY